MSKRKGAHKQRRQRAATPKSSQRRKEYGMALSRQRLDRVGFRPDASLQRTPEAVVESWTDMARREIHRPADAAVTRLTRAFLLLKQSPDLGHLDDLCPLENIITTHGIGPSILNHVFGGGHKAALHLALSSKRMWSIMAASVNYWDFLAGRLQNVGPCSVFISTCPEFTLGEMLSTRDQDPHGLETETPFTDWHNRAIVREDDVVNSLYMVRERLSQGKKKKDDPIEIPQFLRSVLSDKTLDAVKSIQKPKSIWKAHQFKALPHYFVFEPQMIYAATRLQLLLGHIYKQRRHVQALHLHETPFLDRRVLAVVLRACSRVTMVGLYNCPLLHFGDVLPILDLIHEINQERKLSPGHAPLIEALDFYPKFHHGMTAPDGARSSTYGVTTDSMDLDIVQRGLYAIAAKAYLKSRRMGLKLLWDPDRAMRTFLFKVPSPPLSVPTFFDGMCRYLDQSVYEEEKHAALYDMLKPVRLGLERGLDDDFPYWYQEEMGEYLPFCSSCGYEMLFEFFPAGTRRAMPHRRVCAGCTLQALLDDEPHNMHGEKLEALSKLFPDWNGRDYNVEAPTGARGPEAGIMRLKSVETSVEEPPPLQIDEAGELAVVPHVRELRRNNKVVLDSVQGLPTLRDLVKKQAFEENWAAVFNYCTEVDIHARARSRNKSEKLSGTTCQSQDYKNYPCDRYGEVWRKATHAREVQSYDYLAAVKFHAALGKKGW